MRGRAGRTTRPILANFKNRAENARMIKRAVERQVVAALERQAAVAIIGPRQVGKTTLALKIARSRPSVYLDLEAPQDLAKLQAPGPGRDASPVMDDAGAQSGPAAQRIAARGELRRLLDNRCPLYRSAGRPVTVAASGTAACQRRQALGQVAQDLCSRLGDRPRAATSGDARRSAWGTRSWARVGRAMQSRRCLPRRLGPA